MTEDARTRAISNPAVGAGIDWADHSRTQFGRVNVFDGSVLLHMLGTWWRRWFGDSAQLEALYDGTGQAEYETYLQFLDALACLSRFDVPVFHTRNWYYLTLLESDMETSSTENFTYGTDGLVYENRDMPAYGTTPSVDDYRFPVDSRLVSLPSVMNRVIDPSLVLLEKRDYEISNNFIKFYDNPFNNSLIPKRNILDSRGAVVDRQIALWGHLSEWDLEYIYRHFGHVLGIWMKSSEFYKDFINALWDNMVLGSTKRAFKMAWEAITGVRFAEGDEVVAFIESFGDYTHIITDKNLYTYKSTSEFLVQEGDILTPGQALVDTVQVIEPNRSTNWNAVVGVSLGAQFTTGAYKSPLVFQNRETPIEYLGVYPDGKVRVEFSVSGEPGDVADFWHSVHINGFVGGKTLAEYLDMRANKTVPTPECALPEYVNPFKLVMDNLFENNLYAVIVKPENFATDRLCMNATVHLHRHLPPHTTFMTFICLDAVDEYVDLDTYVDDTLNISGAGVYNTDSISEEVIDHGVRIKTVPEECR